MSKNDKNAAATTEADPKAAPAAAEQAEPAGTRAALPATESGLIEELRQLVAKATEAADVAHAGATFVDGAAKKIEAAIAREQGLAPVAGGTSQGDEAPVGRPPQKPSIGRIVQYVPPEGLGAKGSPYPAVITHVWGDRCVNLFVFTDGSYPLQGGHTPTSVNLADSPGQSYSWSWPGRV